MTCLCEKILCKAPAKLAKKGRQVGKGWMSKGNTSRHNDGQKLESAQVCNQLISKYTDAKFLSYVIRYFVTHRSKEKAGILIKCK